MSMSFTLSLNFQCRAGVRTWWRRYAGGGFGNLEAHSGEMISFLVFFFFFQFSFNLLRAER